MIFLKLLPALFPRVQHGIQNNWLRASACPQPDFSDCVGPGSTFCHAIFHPQRRVAEVLNKKEKESANPALAILL